MVRSPTRRHRIDRDAVEIDVLRHLVEYHRLTAAHQHLRVAARGVDHVEVVQGDISPRTGRELAYQGALARLARTGHHHRRHDSQQLRKPLLHEPRQCDFIHDVNDIHSRHRSQAAPVPDTHNPSPTTGAHDG